LRTLPASEKLVDLVRYCDARLRPSLQDNALRPFLGARDRHAFLRPFSRIFFNVTLA
jgi:hypothetical protein